MLYICYISYNNLLKIKVISRIKNKLLKIVK